MFPDFAHYVLYVAALIDTVDAVFIVESAGIIH